MHSIYQDFVDLGTVRGGILFLPATAAVELISRARENNMRVLGVDGFFLTPQTTQPTLEHSVDYSRDFASTPAFDSWSAAKEFILKRQTLGLVYEVVLE